MNNLKIRKILNLSLITLLTITPLSASALTKNESVFSTLNPNGTRYQTTVTNHLKIDYAKELKDESELKKIVNLNGNETFTKNRNTLRWKTDGKDIYYQGTTTKELPLDIKIKYYLNKKEEKIDNIKGKKGKVTIEINLKNKEKKYVNINGQIEEIYTPFMVMAGTILDNKNIEDIKITNGKVINTGTKSIATAVASPGLYESLNIDNLSNINKIKISYKTTKFDMNNIYIIATPKMLEEKDLKLFNNINNLSSNINQLQENMNKINEGSNKLSKYTKELSDGINKLNNNMPTEDSNKKNEDQLNSLKNTNNQTVTTLTSANQSIEKQLKQIDTQISEANNKKSYVTSQISEVETNLNAATTVYNTYNSNLTYINNSIPSLETQIANTTDEETLQTLNKQLGELKGQQQSLQTTVPLLKNQMDALQGTKDALNGTKAAIEGTLELLTQTKTSLNTSIEANKNLSALISGNNKVVDSSINTISKMRVLKNSINKITKGSKQINNGANELAKGITEFNKQGINKITTYSNIIKKYSSKAEALLDLSKNYRGFTSNNSDETIFITKVKTED